MPQVDVAEISRFIKERVGKVQDMDDDAPRPKQKTGFVYLHVIDNKTECMTALNLPIPEQIMVAIALKATADAIMEQVEKEMGK